MGQCRLGFSLERENIGWSKLLDECPRMVQPRARVGVHRLG